MFPCFLAFLLLWFCERSIAIENPTFPAGPVEIEFNPSKCTVRFTLGALLHTVHGSFRVQSGRVRFDPDSGQASGQIAVAVRSGETGESGRDRQMHDSVLESDRFPDAIFSLDHVKGKVPLSGESEIELHGSLRIHGGEHAMTIPVRVKVQNDLVMATAKFALPYVAWGMKDPSNLLLRVDKTVDVEVVLTGMIGAHSNASVTVRPNPPQSRHSQDCSDLKTAGHFLPS
jgi:polyisoprenoid-binding protein YceI